MHNLSNVNEFDLQDNERAVSKALEKSLVCSSNSLFARVAYDVKWAHAQVLW